MIKLYLLLITTSIIANEVELSVSGAQQALMPIAIIVLDAKNKELEIVAHTIKKDLLFTNQFTPTVKNTTKKNILKEIQRLSKAGIPIALCINASSQENIEWRLYDTMQATMLMGKEYKKRGTVERGWAHAIADEAVKNLTGNEGCFSSRIAYCKDSQNDKGATLRKIYIADFDGSNEELLVDLPTICVAPRWHNKMASIFYSEYADTNAPLVSISMEKKRTIVSSFDGINMLASFSPETSATVYCSSRGNGSCQLYCYKNNNLKRFTNNSGNNVSPVFLDEDRICFCSDFQNGNPQIYIGNMATGHLQRITKGGYCTSPAYCAKTNTIAYHKMIHGTMQIMIYDCAKKIHTQLTTSAGNKHEASWSPCGTQLLFAHETNNGKSRLANINILTKKNTYLTRPQEQCSYPHWSACYATFPVVI